MAVHRAEVTDVVVVWGRLEMAAWPDGRLSDATGPIVVESDQSAGPHREVVGFTRTGDGAAELTFARPAWFDNVATEVRHAHEDCAIFDLTPFGKIRVAGIAYDREEHEPGIICIAAPILADRRVIGGLSVTSTTSRHRLEDLERIKPQLLDTAGQIGDQARNWQFPGAS